jgi:chromosome segregation ATPase
MSPELEAAKQRLEEANKANEQFKKEIDALTQAAAQQNYKIKELEDQQTSNLQQAQEKRDADLLNLHKKIETLETSLADASRKDKQTSTLLKTVKLQLNEEKDRNLALKGDVADRVQSNVGHKEGIDLLLETGVITKEQLGEVLRERKEGIDHGKIGQAFINKGFATEDVVVQALAH